jgi:hypothetical protein
MSITTAERLKYKPVASVSLFLVTRRLNIFDILHLHLHLSHLADALIQSDLQIGFYNGPVTNGINMQAMRQNERSDGTLRIIAEWGDCSDVA